MFWDLVGIADVKSTDKDEVGLGPCDGLDRVEHLQRAFVVDFARALCAAVASCAGREDDSGGIGEGARKIGHGGILEGKHERGYVGRDCFEIGAVGGIADDGRDAMLRCYEACEAQSHLSDYDAKGAKDSRLRVFQFIESHLTVAADDDDFLQGHGGRSMGRYTTVAAYISVSGFREASQRR